MTRHVSTQDEDRLEEDHPVTRARWQEARTLFTEAEDANFEHEWVRARESYERVLNDYQETSYADLARGQLAALTDAIEPALTAFETARAKHAGALELGIIEDEPRIGIHLALTYRKLGRYDDSKAEFQRLLLSDPGYAFVHAALGKTYEAEAIRLKRVLKTMERQQQTVWEETGESVDDLQLKVAELLRVAEREVKQALDLEPKNLYAKTALASLLFHNPQRTEEAAAILQEVVGVEPRHWYAWGQLARLYAEMAKSRRPKAERNAARRTALQYYDRALTVRPLDRSLLFGKAFALTISKTAEALQQALECYEAILTRFPDDARTLAGVADTLLDLSLLGLRGKDEAKPFFERALQANPGDRHARKRYAKLLVDEGDPVRAWEIFRPLETLGHADDGDPLSHRIRSDRRRLAEAAWVATRGLRRPEWARMVAPYKEVLRYEPDHLLANLRLSEALLRTGQLGEALKAADRAIAVGELTGQAFAVKAECLQRQKRYHQALATWQSAVNAQKSLGEGIRPDPKLHNPKTLEFYERRVNACRAKLHEASIERRKRRAPPQVLISFENRQTGLTEVHSLSHVGRFLDSLLRTLPIKDVIHHLGDDPVFLVAMTGVGKTVTVPLRVFIRQCDRYFGSNAGGKTFDIFPKVYVVVPRIPIAESEMHHMNRMYRNYLEAVRADSAHGRDLFGCITSVTGQVNADAPILFITTGIFESLAFEGKVDPRRDRIIIDEAHVTIEQNEAVEIGIAICRAKGVVIDYMSATVDIGTIKEDLGVAKVVHAYNRMFPVWLRALKGTLAEKLPEVVRDYLLDSKPVKFPDPGRFSDPARREEALQIRKDLLESVDRPRGLLVVVNSHASEDSDTARVARLLAEHFGPEELRVLRFASAVNRDPVKKQAFDAEIASIEARKGRYVIVSTNVVEMGITYPSLDYVVTLDSEYETEYVDGGQILRVVPLGVNALYQRVGRAGRKRSGMGFIARDVGASYSELPDEELANGLPYERIKYPLAGRGRLQKLALFSFQQAWVDPIKELAKLNLPSKLHLNEEGRRRFTAARARIIALGLAEGRELTRLGRAVMKYIGLEDLQYARLLAEAELGGNLPQYTNLFFLVLAANADRSLRDFFLPRQVVNVDGLNRYQAIELRHAGQDLSTLEKGIKEFSDDIVEQLVSQGWDRPDVERLARALRAGFSLRAKPRLNLDNAETASPEIEGLQEDGALVEVDLISPALPFDREAEPVTIYRLVTYFYNRYVAPARREGISPLERESLLRAMEDECYAMGLRVQVVRQGINAFLELHKQVVKRSRDLGEKIRVWELPVEREDEDDSATNHGEQFDDNLERLCLVGCCLERAAQVRFDLEPDIAEAIVAAYQERAGERWRSPRPWFDPTMVQDIQNNLKERGLELSEDEIHRFFRVVYPTAASATRRALSGYTKPAEFRVLPQMTGPLRQAVLGLYRKVGFGAILYLEMDESKKNYTATRKDETGTALQVKVSPDHTPLRLEADRERIRAKLRPRLFLDEEGEEEKAFECIHMIHEQKDAQNVH